MVFWSPCLQERDSKKKPDFIQKIQLQKIPKKNLLGGYQNIFGKRGKASLCSRLTGNGLFQEGVTEKLTLFL